MARVLPPFGGDPRAVAEVVNGILNGKTNNTGAVTLATGGATTTTITDERIGYDSKIILMATSAASSAITRYISAKGKGTATITHSANITSNVTFDYVIVG
jgi:hypothetical protein